ncbi:MAG: ZIP family metal transporter [Bacteroidota bacterium]
MTWFIYISVFLSVIISGISVLFMRISPKNLKLLLAFSGAYLFAISVMHLIPEIYASGDHDIGFYILIGFLLQVLMEFFSEGIEHGHIHVHEHDHQQHAFPYAMMAALSVHSFLEGMPLAQNYHNELTDFPQRELLAGIILHNIPIAIALMSMLLQSHIKKQAAVLWLLVFALMTPLGTFTAAVIGENLLDISAHFNKLMAIVIGIFLHISTTILFESSENHRFNLIKFLVILSGCAVAMIHF